ncbi:hypothetical protein ABL78_6164 [Leptomonas seymouri]|uniref:MYND-type domain-containing protein n=1 Tax=Leptomonas seymouri TaxID=5684 RepID=A0A0N1HU38_LEPSE|nr:hypothetical protein ABL78_6164 [Leptomonas seymouri]|eukprot:KPI84781.1 hypothetical protein ABL78_6164 [Leptomonas seymouri]
MSASREREQALESQITGLRLSTLETIAHVNYAHNRQVREDLEELKAQVQKLLQRSLPGGTCSVEEHSTGFHPINKCSAALGIASAASLSMTPCGEDGAHMCDYCFAFPPQCFACPHCGREWYCSDVCQRLRWRSHAARCRASAHSQHEVAAAK